MEQLLIELTLKISNNRNGKMPNRGRKLEVSLRYDTVLNDMKRVETKEFKTAYNDRYKVERRFATMVRNHEVHITMANMACNIIRMIYLLYNPSIDMSKI